MDVLLSSNAVHATPPYTGELIPKAWTLATSGARPAWLGVRCVSSRVPQTGESREEEGTTKQRYQEVDVERDALTGARFSPGEPTRGKLGLFRLSRDLRAGVREDPKVVEIQCDHSVPELVGPELECSLPRAPPRTEELVGGRAFSQAASGIELHDKNVKAGVRFLSHPSPGGTT